jgi:hypothetical protein
MLYLVCSRIARATVPWWVPHHERKDYRAYQRERLADQIFTATWRADQGARHTTASADIHVVGSMARLTRGDISPAQALRMLFPEDFA